MDINSQLKTYIAQNLLFSDNGFEYEDNDSFLEHGIVDSTGVLELVLFVEETFGMSVQDSEITRENFDSVNKLTTFVQRKLAA
ncbi:MAG: D-alanine--poly(phosphoribitol) ligase subunit 2 [Anaerolineae bacterium]|nr:D-alanine--poly(phosphoribitol) ligase subunit 2 [Anaerolineae bacterium]